MTGVLGERAGRHAGGTAEQCAQHGSEGVKGRLAEEGSTAQAGQRKKAGREETHFLTPRNLSRPEIFAFSAWRRLDHRGNALFPVVEVGGGFWRKESVQFCSLGSGNPSLYSILGERQWMSATKSS